MRLSAMVVGLRMLVSRIFGEIHHWLLVMRDGASSTPKRESGMSADNQNKGALGRFVGSVGRLTNFRRIESAGRLMLGVLFQMHVTD